MKEKNLQQITIDALEDIKAINTTVMDVKNLTSITDYMIICEGRSSKHLSAIAETVVESIKKHGEHVYSISGKDTTDWVVVDLGDVVLHVMMPESRNFYELEKIWS